MLKIILKLLPLIIHEGFDILCEIRKERQAKKDKENNVK